MATRVFFCFGIIRGLPRQGSKTDTGATLDVPENLQSCKFSFPLVAGVGGLDGRKGRARVEVSN